MSSTQPKYYYIDKIPENWKPSRYGMMCEHLTAGRGEELLTLFRGGSRVKTFQRQGKVQVLPESDPDCGVKWRELFVKYDLDTHGWKTARSLFQEVLLWSSVTLPKWGTLVNGVLSERTTPALPTKGIEFGYLRNWPTPRAGNPGSRPNGKGGKVLNEEVMKAEKIWPTPTKSDGSGGPGCSGRDGGANLRTAVKYPTPLKSDYYSRRKTKNWIGNDLVSFVTEKEEQNGNVCPSAGCHLSPDWVEWLMGWPVGWTDIDREKTELISWEKDPGDTGEMPRVGEGIKNRRQRLEAIGNGQCPQAMVLAWNILKGAYHV
jgi:hypothetical protein